MNSGGSRASQEVPADIVTDLLGVLRGQFYGDLPDKAWYSDRNFLLRNVVLWPAAWLNRRGVTIPPARYKQILLEVLEGVKRHGSTEAVRYWPGYLMHCVQEHFSHHGEEIYKEGKCIRAVAERAMFAFRKASSMSHQVDPVRALAMARDAIVVRRRKPVCKASAPLLPGF